MKSLIEAASRPGQLVGVAPLMRCAMRKEDMQPLGVALLQRAQASEEDGPAWLDLSTYLQLTGERASALAVQAEALRIQQHYRLPARPAPGLRLLALMGPGDLMANTPVEFLLEDSDVALELLYVTADAQLPPVIPEHDVMLVAVAESDANQALLAQLARHLRHWPRPVLNLPSRIAALSRDGVCQALAGMQAVELPLTTRVDRATLGALGTGEIPVSSLLPGDDFPLIVRPLGSHAGHDLEKVDGPADLAAYLGRVAGDGFYLARFVDYRSADGQFRKYRVVLVQGKPYLCHLAVSSHWMIHYLNAGMGESADKRREEAECMAHFDEGFAARHAAALAEIDQRIGLSYVGIDCAETPDGRLLVFEIDNAMIVHGMDPEDVYPYKKAAMAKVFAAFRAMLGEAAGARS
jgi:glutathione synthase/RimK-type ligase-like ATP-grasp enzyme